MLYGVQSDDGERTLESGTDWRRGARRFAQSVALTRRLFSPWSRDQPARRAHGGPDFMTDSRSAAPARGRVQPEIPAADD
jgi:hypothetical protein